MATSKPTNGPSARTFFLNERQEFTSFERSGGGKQLPLADINWEQQSSDLAASFRRAVGQPHETKDPTHTAHKFVVVVPAPQVARLSSSKQARNGRVVYEPNFGGDQSKIFRRIGLDLLETLPNGSAVVHVPATRVSQLLSTIAALPSSNLRDQTRWGNLALFEPTAWTMRIDPTWLSELRPEVPVEAFVRFQPMLSRLEVQELLQTFSVVFGDRGSPFVRAGREFSGRHWCLGMLTPEQLHTLALEFSSIQSIHPRWPTPLAASARRKGPRAQAFSSPSSLPSLSLELLPTVGVVDSGIPREHAQLGPYRRAGYRNPNLDPTVSYVGDHGSTVASCVVFGDVDTPGSTPPGKCRVVDVMVAYDTNSIQDELVVGAIDAILGTAPDVRVFNLSFGGKPLPLLKDVERREELLKLQELDNLAFARDVVLVYAAGNSAKGLVPEKPYPHHLDDPRWSLGAHACSFNGAVCGSYVDRVGEECVAGVRGAPSPFTRVGPGLVESPVPGFAAPGGDTRDDYAPAPSTGVGVFTAEGFWEDRAGTSLAAPLISREVAWMFQELARYCDRRTTPFAGTVKAWMNLVASRLKLQGSYEVLASRTLGRGLPTVQRLQQPLGGSAVFIWQTVLQAANSVASVNVPIPALWLKEATAPRLRIVAAWNTPVNAALEGWGCRKVTFKLRPCGETLALRASRSAAAGAYPLLDREFNISTQHLLDKGLTLSDAPWILETEYAEVGEYPSAMTISPQQRVGVVLELWDEAEEPVSPQHFVQALPIALELDRLSVLDTPIQVPVTIKN